MTVIDIKIYGDLFILGPWLYFNKTVYFESITRFSNENSISSDSGPYILCYILRSGSKSSEIALNLTSVDEQNL